MLHARLAPLNLAEDLPLFLKALKLNLDGLVDREVSMNKELQAEEKFSLGHGAVSRVLRPKFINTIHFRPTMKPTTKSSQNLLYSELDVASSNPRLNVLR
jgi:hypothetical protein